MRTLIISNTITNNNAVQIEESVNPKKLQSILQMYRPNIIITRKARYTLKAKVPKYTRGHLFLLAGSSCVGKTTIIKQALKWNNDYRFIPSYTTRAKRKNETNKVQYHYISIMDFIDLKNMGYFCETNILFGNLYGVPKHNIEEALDSGEIIIKDIDVEGALKLKDLYPEDITIIHINAESTELIEKRLRLRGDTDLIKRIDRIYLETELKEYFEYRLINRDNYATTRRLQSIIKKVMNRKKAVNKE